MIRVILPVAVIAAILFAPMFSEVTTGTVTGEQVTVRSGNYFVENTIQCFRDGNFSIADKCEPKGGLQGKLIFGAVFVSAVAAVLGVLGLIPVIGRLTSAITTLAGVVVIAAIGFFLLNMMGSKEGLEGVQWGSYLAGGGGLLTLVSGLSGMRGK